MLEWTFISTHGLVLSYIASHPHDTGPAIASAIGISERATRKIIVDLVESGYITIKRKGRRNRYKVNAAMHLRHSTHSEIAVGDLLNALGWKRPSKLQKRATRPTLRERNSNQVL